MTTKPIMNPTYFMARDILRNDNLTDKQKKISDLLNATDEKIKSERQHSCQENERGDVPGQIR